MRGQERAGENRTEKDRIGQDRTGEDRNGVGRGAMVRAWRFTIAIECRASSILAWCRIF